MFLFPGAPAAPRRVSALLVLLLTPPVAGDLPAQELDTTALRGELEERIGRHRGRVHLALTDAATGRELLSIRGDEPVASASLVKVPLLVEVFHQAEHGALALDDPLVLLEADKQPGSGILQYLDAPHRLTVRDAATLMITLSDNTATNLLIDKVGIRSVWERMEALGLPRTKLHSKTFLRATSVAMDSSEVYGLGVTTASEFARLLGLIHRGEAVSPEASAAMKEMLARQFYEEGIPRHLPGEVAVAHKTGALSDARHDCGIVDEPSRPYVLCVLTTGNEDQGWRLDVEPHLLIADLSRIVHRYVTAGTRP